MKKIGEGAYSDVFAIENEDVVIKLIPFEGSFIFHGRRQLRVHQMLSEVIATQAVSNLSFNSGGEIANSSTQNFVKLKGLSVLIGSMPSYLLTACKAYEKIDASRGYKIGRLSF